ncbi:MAG: xylulokinase [Candidatus Freyarchaeota archaeon]
MTYLLGLDIGTTNCKAVLINENGEVKAFLSSGEYQIIRPQPDWAEEDPRDWWEATKKVVKQLVSSSGVKPDDIEAIGVSSTEEGVVPVDKNGEPLYNCMIWQDSRNKEQEAWAYENADFFKVLNITGLPIAYLWSAEKVLWIKQNHPEMYEKTHKFLQPKDYINYKLTGEYTTDWSIAGHTQLFDITRREWSEELMELFGISPDMWPDVKPCTEIIGELGSSVAEELGLKSGTRVIAGAGDQEGGVVGAGAIEAGQALESAGTSSVLNIVLSKPVFDYRTTVFCHPYPDLWIMELYPPPSGEALQWFRENFTREQPAEEAFSAMDREAEERPAGSNNLLFAPLFHGKLTSEINPIAKAVVFGLDFNHTRGDLIRALMEGTSYELREILDFVEKEFKIGLEEIKVSGGVANSRVWREIRANVTGRKMILPEMTETTVYGDAVLASIGVEVFKPQKAATLNKTAETTEPQKTQKEKYDKIYQLYQKLYESLKDLYTELQNI